MLIRDLVPTDGANRQLLLAALNNPIFSMMIDKHVEQLREQLLAVSDSKPDAELATDFRKWTAERNYWRELQQLRNELIEEAKTMTTPKGKRR